MKLFVNLLFFDDRAIRSGFDLLVASKWFNVFKKKKCVCLNRRIPTNYKLYFLSNHFYTTTVF